MGRTNFSIWKNFIPSPLFFIVLWEGRKIGEQCVQVNEAVSWRLWNVCAWEPRGQAGGGDHSCSEPRLREQSGRGTREGGAGLPLHRPLLLAILAAAQRLWNCACTRLPVSSVDNCSSLRVKIDRYRGGKGSHFPWWVGLRLSSCRSSRTPETSRSPSPAMSGETRVTWNANAGGLDVKRHHSLTSRLGTRSTQIWGMMTFLFVLYPVYRLSLHSWVHRRWGPVLPRLRCKMRSRGIPHVGNSWKGGMEWRGEMWWQREGRGWSGEGWTWMNISMQDEVRAKAQDVVPISAKMFTWECLKISCFIPYHKFWALDPDLGSGVSTSEIVSD